MARLWEDERVRRGMEAQLARRRELLDAGERALGWKLGFGTPQAMEKLGTTGPLVGFLTSGTQHEPGASVAVGALAGPVVEPEIAVHLGGDVARGATEDETRAAIAALGPAIEVADVGAAPDGPEELLAGNIIHRAVLLGPAVGARTGGDTSGLGVTVSRDGSQVASAEEAVAAIGGDLLGLVRHTADVLDAFGERLRAGDVVICGSTIAPPPPAEPGLVRVDLDDLGALEVRLTV